MDTLVTQRLRSERVAMTMVMTMMITKSKNESQSRDDNPDKL